MKKRFILLMTTVILSAVLVACGNETAVEETEEGVVEETEIEKTENIEEIETEETVEETPNADMEESEEFEYIVREDGKIQPAARLGGLTEMKEFVDSLELTELVLLYHDEDESTIVYNGDEFVMEERPIRFTLYSYKEMEEIFTTSETDVEVLKNNQYSYEVSISWSTQQYLYFNVTYADGTVEEITIHLIPERIYYDPNDTGYYVREDGRYQLTIGWEFADVVMDEYIIPLQINEPILIVYENNRVRIIYNGDRFVLTGDCDFLLYTPQVLIYDYSYRPDADETLWIVPMVFEDYLCDVQVHAWSGWFYGDVGFRSIKTCTVLEYEDGTSEIFEADIIYNCQFCYQ